jgi:putative DNA primase/helicase
LVAQHGHDLRYCFPRKAWFAWDETKWANDITGEVYRRAKATVETIYSEAARQAEEDERKRTAKWAISSESHQRIEAMIDLARSESGIPVKQEEFDSNQWLSNCLNGTINLKTGELLPHQREHLITRMIPVTYDPNADCPLWLDFINDITNGNSEIAGFLQRAAGYSLTGETSEECLFINYGVGRNGKSVLLNTLMGIMGDYAVKVSPDLLMAFKRRPAPYYEGNACQPPSGSLTGDRRRPKAR